MLTNHGVYQELVDRNEVFKTMLTGSPAFYSFPDRHHFPFACFFDCLHRLRAWNRLATSKLSGQCHKNAVGIPGIDKSLVRDRLPVFSGYQQFNKTHKSRIQVKRLTPTNTDENHPSFCSYKQLSSTAVLDSCYSIKVHPLHFIRFPLSSPLFVYSLVDRQGQPPPTPRALPYLVEVLWQ